MSSPASPPASRRSPGCASTSTFVHSDATLGRVVVYRNGIAYFERTAHIDGDSLRLAVPADKVDDFLKSLTVVDAKTGEPAPIAYPTARAGLGVGAHRHEDQPDRGQRRAISGSRT